MTKRSAVIQISPKGQVTLPADVRRAPGVGAGDHLVVAVEDGRVVLSPAVVLPIEIYDADRVEAFAAAAAMTPAELKKARARWGVR